MNIRRARPRSFTNFGEIGRSGLNHWGGEIREEFLRELKGKDGRKILKEMSDNDPIIGSVLFCISMLIRQAKPFVKPSPTKPEKEGQADADFVHSCFNDMSETWEDLVTEMLSMIIYGWAYHEVVYKRRGGPSRDPSKNSRFTDGKIGWRKMPLRAQDTLKKWDIDDFGGIQGLTQKADTTTGSLERYIPIVKALLFRTTHSKNNPEGRSMLRNAYRPWYFKKRIEEIEGIGVERDLAGLPVIKGPEDFDLWNENDPVAVQALREAEIIVSSIRRDEQEGIVLPFGWELELLASAGKRNFDTTQVINRYNNVMAMTLMADFIVLGHNNRYGSFALSSNKTHMFAVALGGWLDSIASTFNRYAIPRLMELNGMDTENPPILEFADIELPDLTELGTYIKNLSDSGFQIFPNQPIEKKLLEAASLPTQNVELGRKPLPPPAPTLPGGPNAQPKPGAPPVGPAPGGAKVKPANKPSPGGNPSRTARPKKFLGLGRRHTKHIYLRKNGSGHRRASSGGRER